MFPKISNIWVIFVGLFAGIFAIITHSMFLGIVSLGSGALAAIDELLRLKEENLRLRGMVLRLDNKVMRIFMEAGLGNNKPQSEDYEDAEGRREVYNGPIN